MMIPRARARHHTIPVTGKAHHHLLLPDHQCPSSLCLWRPLLYRTVEYAHALAIDEIEILLPRTTTTTTTTPQTTITASQAADPRIVPRKNQTPPCSVEIELLVTVRTRLGAVAHARMKPVPPLPDAQQEPPLCPLRPLLPVHQLLLGLAQPLARRPRPTRGRLRLMGGGSRHAPPPPPPPLLHRQRVVVAG